MIYGDIGRLNSLLQFIFQDVSPGPVVFFFFPLQSNVLRFPQHPATSVLPVSLQCVQKIPKLSGCLVSKKVI